MLEPFTMEYSSSKHIRRKKNIDAIQFNCHAKEKTKRSYFGSSSLAFVAMLLAQVQNQLLLATEQEGAKKVCFGKPAIAIQGCG